MMKEEVELATETQIPNRQAVKNSKENLNISAHGFMASLFSFKRRNFMKKLGNSNLNSKLKTQNSKLFKVSAFRFFANP